MKTLVSVITGRKDYPIFDTDDHEKIVEHLKQTDWDMYEVTETKEGLVSIDDGDFGGDTLKIIDIKIIKLK